MSTRIKLASLALVGIEVATWHVWWIGNLGHGADAVAVWMTGHALAMIVAAFVFSNYEEPKP